MKKYFYTLLGIIFFLFAFSKGIEIDIAVQPVDNKANKNNITITVMQGEPDLTYSLYDKEPWTQGGTLIKKSAPIPDYSYTFHNINKGTYYILVIDGKNNLKGRYITMK